MNSVTALLALAVVVLTFVATKSTAAKIRRLRPPADVRQARGDLNHYQIAFLAGGPRRVVVTALATLAATRAIEIARGGRVGLVRGAASYDPVELAVLDAVAARPGRIKVAAIRGEVARGPVLEGLRRDLAGRGMLIPEQVYAPAGRSLGRLRRISQAALVTAVIVVGLGGASVQSIVMAVVVAGFAMYAHAVASEANGDRRNAVSAAGDAELAAARDVYREGGPPVAPGVVHEVGMPVALYGPGELRDERLRRELTRDGRGKSSGDGDEVGGWSDGGGDGGSGGDGGGGE
ncbi:TIGR04222 domain-containing membrane protein [Spongiactinospora sp. 9N601]|uniref:TIGR04222 domain-containing membrane protein n=1 Tax=Spongiactinospora sp. 9N601 TaxID=3375149 RepID=UPI0037B2FCEB